MDRFKTLGNKLAVSASLPSESAPQNPVVEVIGYRRILIENHKGIAEYGSNRIVANVAFGQICISGDHLELAEMTKANLVITGVIHCVNITRKVG